MILSPTMFYQVYASWWLRNVHQAWSQGKRIVPVLFLSHLVSACLLVVCGGASVMVLAGSGYLSHWLTDGPSTIQTGTQSNKETCNKMPKFTWYSIICILFMPPTAMYVVLPAIMGYSFCWPYLLLVFYSYRYISICTCMPISFFYLVTNLLILQSSLQFLLY